MINGITASLANAARKIVEDSRAKAAEESALNIAKLQEKMMKPAHSGTAPRNDQERKLAAMTPPTDKITHGDVLKGRGVKKEELEQTDEAMSHQATTTMKHIANPTPGERKAAKDIKPGIAGYRDRIAMLKSAEARGGLKKEEIVNEAPMDGVAPGSMEDGKHMCATKVFHKEWKEGKPLFSQHAEPDWNADGYIAWYDVMFEHGIEKKVPVTELNILTQESHMHSKKKKM
jgi:hypothetical protein